MRLMLARPVSGEWLDLNAPAVGAPAYTRALSAPGSVDFALPREYTSRISPDGRWTLAEWGTVAIVEGDDQEILAYGLVDSVVPDGEVVRVSAGGVSSTSKDIPWTTTARSWISKDGLQAWREVWQHINSAEGTIPLEIVGDATSGVLVGRPESTSYRSVRLQIEAAQRLLKVAETDLAEAERMMRAAARSLYAVAGLKKVGPISSRTYVPSGTGKPWECVLRIDGTTPGNVVHAYFWVQLRGVHQWASFSQTLSRGRGDAYRLWERRRGWARDRVKAQEDIIRGLEQWIRDVLPNSHADPYLIAWHSNRDLSTDLENLRELGGFEWFETARWDGEKVVPQIEARKRVGERLEDIRLTVGVNVPVEPIMVSPDYASEVRVFGSGEGSETLHAERVRVDDIRVRKVRPLTDKDARTQQLVDAIRNKESRNLLAEGLVLDQITVVDHDFAPFGSFGLGDEIHINGLMGDGTRLDRWVRIMEITRDSSDSMTLTVEEVWWWSD